MFKIRFVLTIFSLVFGYLFYAGITADHSAKEQGWVLNVIATSIFGTLLFWTLFMLVSYTFGAKKNPDGAICLTPGHPLLKVADFAKQNAWDEITLCPLYWKISLLTIVGWILIFEAAAIMFFVFIAPFLGNFIGLIVLGCIAALVGIAVIYDKKLQRYALCASVAHITIATLVGLIALLIFTLIITEIGLWQLFVMLATAIGFALAFVGIVMAVVYFGLWGTSIVIATPAGTWLSKKGVTIKNRWCPPIEECQNGTSSTV